MQIRNHIFWGVGMMVFIFSVNNAYAQSPLPLLSGNEPSLSMHTLQRLELIQAETVLLEAQAARAKVQRELDEVPLNSNKELATNVPQTQQQIFSRSTYSLPVVQEIYGNKKRLVAQIVTAEGGITTVSVGQIIQGTNYKVTSITSKSVQVSDGIVTQTLAFN